MTTPDKADVAVTEEDAVEVLCRPIIGMENRSPLEVFDIMADRIRGAARLAATPPPASAGEVEAMCARLLECEPARFHNGTKWVGKPFNRDGAEAASMLAAIAAMSPRVEGEPVAYLKEWISRGEARSRVDRSREHEPWLDAYSPVITPLAALSTPSPEKDETIAALRAENVELRNRGAKAIIAYHVAIYSPKGVVPDDSFYDPLIADRCERELQANRAALARLPDSGEGKCAPGGLLTAPQR